MKKYHSLIRYPKDEAVTMLENCSHMLITEKIDGQNASFKRDIGSMEIKTFSRRMEIVEDGHPFRKWVLENIDPLELIEGVIYFGEWLTKHRRIYDEKKYLQFYLYDMYIEPLEVYVNPYESIETLQLVVNTDGMNVAPVYYDGPPLKSVDDIKAFYVESLFDGKPAEGVVVKDYNYRDRFGQCTMVKFINPVFEESKEVKKSSNRELSENDKLILQWVHSHITEERIEKTIMKLQDEGSLPSQLTMHLMGDMMKLVPKEVISDAIEEELDELDLPLSGKEVIHSINKSGQKIVGEILRRYVKQKESEVRINE